jgi:hypothetical protein
VVEQRVVGGRDQQQVLMPLASVGVRNPKRQPEQIRDRTRQANGTREPHDRAVLRSSREQLRGLRRRRCTGDRKPRIVNDPVGMEGLPAANGGESRQHRPDREASDLAKQALVTFPCRASYIHPLRTPR